MIGFIQLLLTVLGILILVVFLAAISTVRAQKRPPARDSHRSKHGNKQQ